ncbi:hypothetical protein BTVI_59760 [Pitangus sulphuratus]|nr:hypothetical protein BTVI_59760 [Pitangus sulphuratus]
MPTGSKMDFLLLPAKAKPIRSNSNASVITYSRKEGCCAERIPARKERSENMGTTMQTARSVQKEGQEVLQVLELRPCSPWCRPEWGDCAPAAHGGPSGCRDPPAAHGGAHAGAGGCRKEAVTPWEAQDGAGPDGDLQPMERETHAGTGFSWVGLVTPVGDPCWYSSSVKDCTP